jgi:hypothetical protein
MINTMGLLIDSYYSLLNGQLTYGGVSVDVYKEDAPEGQEGHYVLLIAEGEVYDGNKSSFADQSTVVVDIVTIFNNNVDTSVANEIDRQIQILNVQRESSTYMRETDGVRKYYRKVSRYKQRVS